MLFLFLNLFPERIENGSFLLVKEGLLVIKIFEKGNGRQRIRILLLGCNGVHRWRFSGNHRCHLRSLPTGSSFLVIHVLQGCIDYQHFRKVKNTTFGAWAEHLLMVEMSCEWGATACGSQHGQKMSDNPCGSDVGYKQCDCNRKHKTGRVSFVKSQRALLQRKEIYDRSYI